MSTSTSVWSMCSLRANIVLLEEACDGREVVPVVRREEQLRLVAHPLLLDGHVAVHLPLAQVAAQTRRPLGAQRLEVPVRARSVQFNSVQFSSMRSRAPGHSNEQSGAPERSLERFGLVVDGVRLGGHEAVEAGHAGASDRLLEGARRGSQATRALFDYAHVRLEQVVPVHQSLSAEQLGARVVALHPRLFAQVHNVEVT